MFETMTSAFVDEFPDLLRKRKTLWTGLLCLMEFLLGLPFVTKGGIYLLQIMDWYSSAFSLMILSFLECVVIAYIYGVDQFYNDIALMIGRKPPLWYKLSWMGITPFTIMFILIFTMVMHEPVTYGDYSYPTWAIMIGWIMAMVSLVPLPIIMVLETLKQDGTLSQRIKKAMRPAEDWGPATKGHKEMYYSSLPPNQQKPNEDMQMFSVTNTNSESEKALLQSKSV